jgi:hypothetical protein
VYLCFDADDTLLYVGITVSGFERFAGHRKNGSVWTRDVARIEIEHLATRKDAADRERELIQTLHPKHNIQHALPETGMSIDQAAAMLHLSRKSILRLIRDGRLVAERGRGGVAVTEGAISDLLDDCANVPRCIPA